MAPVFDADLPRVALDGFDFVLLLFTPPPPAALDEDDGGGCRAFLLGTAFMEDAPLARILSSLSCIIQSEGKLQTEKTIIIFAH